MLDVENAISQHHVIESGGQSVDPEWCAYSQTHKYFSVLWLYMCVPPVQQMPFGQNILHGKSLITITHFVCSNMLAALESATFQLLPRCSLKD